MSNAAWWSRTSQAEGTANARTLRQGVPSMGMNSEVAIVTEAGEQGRV